MESKKELAPVISFSTSVIQAAQGQGEDSRYGVLGITIRAEDSGSDGSNFKVLRRTIELLNAAGMRSDQIQLPEGQGYQVTKQTGVVSLKSTEPSSGIVSSQDRVVMYQIVPNSENILGSGSQDQEGLVSVDSLPRGSDRLVVKMTVVEPIRLPEFDKKAA